MNKIGIVTYHGADNYGSVLQAYALLNSVEKLTSKEVEIVNYVSSAQKNMYSIFFKGMSLKCIIKNMYILLVLYRKMFRRSCSFVKFRRDCLKVNTDNSADTVEEIDFSVYSTLICGSDQIWNIKIKDFDPTYMLEGTHQNKLSYAASMGGIDLHLDDYECKMIEERLRSFTAVSVRENIARQMLSQCNIPNVNVNIDPVFLLEINRWKQIIKERPINEKYIFFYSIDYNQESVEIARWYSKHFKLPVVIMFTSWQSYFICKDGIFWSQKTDVEDFLSLIFYAQFVLSGSFHGTAFSILFNKPFYRIQKIINGEKVIDDRVRTLFSKLGISAREIDIDNYREKADTIYEIEFTSINEKIEHERDSALSYLRENIV